MFSHNTLLTSGQHRRSSDERTIAKRKRECSPTKSASNGASENLTRVRSTLQNVSDSMLSIDCVDVPVCDNRSVASQDFMQQCCTSRVSENSDERPDTNSADRLLHAGQAAYAMRSFGMQTNERSSSAAFLQSKKWCEKEKALKAQNERLRSTVDAYKKELERLKEECHVSKLVICSNMQKIYEAPIFKPCIRHKRQKCSG